MSDDQKARITSIKLWPEDFDRIETLQRHLQGQLPADMRARVSLGSVIRTVLASAVCAVPADPAAPPQPTLVLGSIEPEPPKRASRKHPDEQAEPAAATKAKGRSRAGKRKPAPQAEGGEEAGAGGMTGWLGREQPRDAARLDRRFKRRRSPPPDTGV